MPHVSFIVHPIEYAYGFVVLCPVLDMTLRPLLLTWISNFIHYKMWDEITHTFPNFNGCAIDVWEWISNFIPHFTVHVITYPCCELIHVSKRGLCSQLIHVTHLPMAFRVASLALGQSYDCPSASDVTLKDKGKMGLLNHNKAWTVCIFLGCITHPCASRPWPKCRPHFSSITF